MFVGASEIEKNLSAPAAGIVLDLQLMKRDGLDVRADAMPGAVEGLAAGDAADGIRSERADFRAAKHEALGFGHGKQLGEPGVKQRFLFGAGGFDFAGGALCDGGEIAGERKKRERRIREKFFARAAIGAEADVGGMLENFEGRLHGGVIVLCGGARC